MKATPEPGELMDGVTVEKHVSRDGDCTYNEYIVRGTFAKCKEWEAANLGKNGIVISLRYKFPGNLFKTYPTDGMAAKLSVLVRMWNEKEIRMWGE